MNEHNHLHHRVSIVLTCLFFMTAQPLISQETFRPAYEEALKAPWQETFHDSGQDDWQDKWFLDGRKATVENTDEGMFFAAGPIAGDHASHAVLWTKESFEGDLKLEFDFTRMDTIYHYVCIVYLYATGAGPAPYTEDIEAWRNLRQIPFMRSYFDHMNLLHVSFAAFGNKSSDGKDSAYIRARRYPRSLFEGDFAKMALEPDFSAVGLFEPGVPHHVTFIRRGNEFFMNVENPEGEHLFRWDLSQMPSVNQGRIGLRHMYQRAGIYQNISVSQPDEDTSAQ